MGVTGMDMDALDDFEPDDGRACCACRWWAPAGDAATGRCTVHGMETEETDGMGCEDFDDWMWR